MVGVIAPVVDVVDDNFSSPVATIRVKFIVDSSSKFDITIRHQCCPSSQVLLVCRTGVNRGLQMRFFRYEIYLNGSI